MTQSPQFYLALAPILLYIINRISLYPSRNPHQNLSSFSLWIILMFIPNSPSNPCKPFRFKRIANRASRKFLRQNCHYATPIVRDTTAIIGRHRILSAGSVTSGRVARTAGCPGLFCILSESRLLNPESQIPNP